jgi:hypothetical protein
LKHEAINEEQQATAALFALGALSQRESTSFDAHLREGCAVCESALAEFEIVTESLAVAVPEASPAPYLRDLLMARIEREAQDAPRRTGGSVVNFPERSIPADASKQMFWKAALPWALAASFLIAFVVSFVAWRMDRQEMNDLISSNQQEASSAVKDNLELREKLRRESTRTDELNQINAVLSSANWRVLTLAGQEPAPSASAKVYWDIKSNRWVVSADLPPAPPGKTYQLWFVTHDAKISAGLISPDQSGHGFAVVRIPSNVTRLAAAAITLEPEGGSPQPTMPIYALGKA